MPERRKVVGWREREQTIDYAGRDYTVKLRKIKDDDAFFEEAPPGSISLQQLAEMMCLTINAVYARRNNKTIAAIRVKNPQANGHLWVYRITAREIERLRSLGLLKKYARAR